MRVRGTRSVWSANAILEHILHHSQSTVGNGVAETKVDVGVAETTVDVGEAAEDCTEGVAEDAAEDTELEVPLRIVNWPEALPESPNKTTM